MKNVSKSVSALTLGVLLMANLASCGNDEETIVKQPTNTAPVLDNKTIKVLEHVSDTETLVTLTATDKENDELTYTVIENSDDLFEISNTGVVSLLAGKVLDYETAATHTLKIQVSDGTLKTVATLTINITDELEVKSATAANFSNVNKRRNNEYDFSFGTNAVKIEIENYNESYTYELKLTGDYFKKEYTVALTKTNTIVKDIIILEKDASKTSSTNVVAPPVLSPIKTLLHANVEDLQMEADTYKAVLVEKESTTEFAVSGVDDYVVLDLDSPHFLSTTRIENDSYQPLTTLDLNQTRFRVRPNNPGYIKGVGVSLGIYDVNLTKIANIPSSGSNGSSQGTFSYRFNSTQVNDVITADGTYLFRLEEVVPTNTLADANKVYKKGIFQKIAVTKITERKLIKNISVLK